MAGEALLHMKGVSKAFHGVSALKSVEFSLLAGEIHALLGENGAGKSTLMKILCGNYTADAGEICIEGRPVSIHSPTDARKLGVGIIHQELMLAPHLSVAENIFLGREPTKWGKGFDRRALYRDAAALLEELSIALDERELVMNLTVAQRQLVEIAKAMSQEPKILIMDEPTSALPESEVDHLLTRMEQLRERGIGIVYISHKMDEIQRIADRGTVLRDGEYIGTLERGEMEIERIIEMMVGRKDAVGFHRSRGARSDEVVLQAQNLNNEKLRDCSFQLHKGEILGVAGLMGAGRSELMRAVFGIDALRSGRVLVGGKPCKLGHPSNLIERRVGFAPEDRKDQALFLDMSVWSNISAVQLYHKRGPVRRIAQEKTLGERYRGELNIHVSDLGLEVKRLSGGNQQKVVISRWLANEPEILILDEPTRGIDVGAKREIYEILSNLASEGMSIIVVSSEMPELLAIADRILVMSEGKITGELSAEEATQQKIMALAAVGVERIAERGESQ